MLWRLMKWPHQTLRVRICCGRRCRLAPCGDGCLLGLNTHGCVMAGTSRMEVPSEIILWGPFPLLLALPTTTLHSLRFYSCPSSSISSVPRTSAWLRETGSGREQEPITKHLKSHYCCWHHCGGLCFYRYHKCKCLPIREAVSIVCKSRYKLTQYTHKSDSANQLN